MLQILSTSTKQQKLNDFCHQMVSKYQVNYYYDGENYQPQYTAEQLDELVNYRIGKLGEMAVKIYLGSLISNVDYNIYPVGDGGTDFYLNSNPEIKIQVKTRILNRIPYQRKIDTDPTELAQLNQYQQQKINNNLDRLLWSISSKEKQLNQIIIFVIIVDQIGGNELLENSLYNFVLAGFLPINTGLNLHQIKLKDMYYLGGIKFYINHCL